MRIGIIGAGHIGGTLARLLVDAGHEVTIANSRAPETLRDFVRELGRRACAATARDAARFGEVVIVAIPFGRHRELPREGFDGKTVIDAMNYFPQGEGRIAALETGRTTSSELVQAELPGARVVKAFNDLLYEWLVRCARPRGARDRVAIAISGDDAAAKATVAALADQLGFDAVDAGSLARGGRRHQVGTAAFGVAVTADELRRRLAMEAEPYPMHPGP